MLATSQWTNTCGLLACCYAINDVNRQAETPAGRIWLCKCFQEIVKLSQFTKLIGMPEQCDIPNAVPFDPKMDCGRYVGFSYYYYFEFCLKCFELFALSRSNF